MKTSADLLVKTREAASYGIKIDGAVAADMAAILARKQQILDSPAQGNHEPA